MEAAHERFTGLEARPFIERCIRELKGSGLAPARRTNTDPARLTPQEHAVARLAATGMTNRDIAAEMAISTKTVQFHVSNVYAKLGVRSRLQLANRLGRSSATAEPADEG